MFCPECGGELRQVRELGEFWAEFLRCLHDERHSFLNVLDARWIYPLQPLQQGVPEAIERSDTPTLRLAFGRIKAIDYKTISIVMFEQTLLGCYDPNRDYDIVYPGAAPPN